MGNNFIYYKFLFLSAFSSKIQALENTLPFSQVFFRIATLKKFRNLLTVGCCLTKKSTILHLLS